MPTITYNIKVENSITYPDLEHKKFRYSEVSEDRFFQTHTDSTADILHSKLGWSEPSTILLDDNNIIIGDQGVAAAGGHQPLPGPDPRSPSEGHRAGREPARARCV